MTTTARLIQSLETVLFELMRMDRTIDDAKDLIAEERRQAEREIDELYERADAMMTRLSAAQAKPN